MVIINGDEQKQKHINADDDDVSDDDNNNNKRRQKIQTKNECREQKKISHYLSTFSPNEISTKKKKDEWRALELNVQSKGK